MNYSQFTENNYSQFIDNIYHSMDIYRSVIVYNDYTKKNMNNLYNLLLSKDYPVAIISNSCNYDIDRMDRYTDHLDCYTDHLDRYKMYIIHEDLLEYIDHYCDTSSINVLFCLDDTPIHNKIINTNLNKIFIFSNIK
jgi:hypothetical protein